MKLELELVVHKAAASSGLLNLKASLDKPRSGSQGDLSSTDT